MSLLQKINDDLKAALLSRDSDKVNTLRMLKSSIHNQEIANGKELSDEEIGQVVAKEVKKREEAIVEYKKGNRQDLVDAETKEAEILKVYLPKQISDQELEKIVDQAIKETKAQNSSDMGKVMAQVMPKVVGKASGAKVSEIVKNKLAA
jgi:uncharacterized protein YqeY